MKMESLQQRREELERKEFQLKESLLKFDKFLKVCKFNFNFLFGICFPRVKWFLNLLLKKALTAHTRVHHAQGILFHTMHQI